MSYSMNGLLGSLALARCAVVVLMFGVNMSAAAQVLAASDPKTDQPLTATRPLDDVYLEGDSLDSLLSVLAQEYDIPIGLERAMKGPGLIETRIDSKKITLGELLTQLLADYKEYAWEISDGAVYVFPKEGYRDPIVERLLNIEIRKFSLQKGTAVWNVEETLLKAPEFEEVVNAYGLGTLGWTFSGFYIPHLGRNYTLEVSGAKVRSLLNQIVKESPTAKFWSIGRDSNSHTFSVSLSARQEEVSNPRRIDLKELKRLSYAIP